MFDPLKRAARMIFQDEVRLQRNAGGLRFALENAADLNKVAAPTAQQLAQAREQVELLRMQSELQVVLNEAPALRRPPRQLVQVQQALGAEGLALLGTLPLVVLRRALDQLEDAVNNWSPQGLAALRSKMAVAVQERTLKGEPDGSLDLTPEDMHALQDAAADVETSDHADEQAALMAAYGALQGSSSSPQGNFATSTTPSTLN